MTDQHARNKRSRRSSRGPNWSLMAIPVIFLLAAGAIWYLLEEPGAKRGDTTVPDRPGHEAAPITEPSPSTTPPVAETERLDTTSADAPPDSPPLPVQTETEDVADTAMITDTQPSPTPAPPPSPEELCRNCRKKLVKFFTQLDQQEYIREVELGAPSQDYFVDLAHKLLDNPPVVVRETDDLYTILRNMAHFFRVIGKKNIHIIKTILDRDRDKIEDVAAELYHWTVAENCASDEFPLIAPLDKMYEYAGFFLNTMGGRSYLFRRDSRCRLLVNYYAVLIIDQANKKGLNRHGLAIDQIIPRLISEVEASNQLIYKENYLDKLYELLERYQVSAPVTPEPGDDL